MALPFTLKAIVRQKKSNYENSNVSQCKNTPNLQKKHPLKETKSPFKIL
jgi:hypothetical protein